MWQEFTFSVKCVSAAGFRQPLTRVHLYCTLNFACQMLKKNDEDLYLNYATVLAWLGRLLAENQHCKVSDPVTQLSSRQHRNTDALRNP